MKRPFSTLFRRANLLVWVGAALSPGALCAALPLRPPGGGCPFCGGSFAGTDGLGMGLAPTSGPVGPDTSRAAAPVVPPALVAPPAPKPVIARASRAGLTPPPVRQGPDGYWRVGFLNLASFDYVAPSPEAPHKAGARGNIPDRVCELEGRRVALRGYMLPLKVEQGLVKEFLLIRSPMVCCYGVVPAPNEWVVVRMQGAGTMAMMDTPMVFYGVLHVGEIYEDNVFAGIYALDGERASIDG